MKNAKITQILYLLRAFYYLCGQITTPDIVMIKHIVLFKLKASDEKETLLKAIKTQLENLSGVIPELKEIHVGINVNESEKWDLSLEALVENMHDLEVYANHPAHQHIVKTLIAPAKEDRACVDYQIV